MAKIKIHVSGTTHFEFWDLTQGGRHSSSTVGAPTLKELKAYYVRRKIEISDVYQTVCI